jgi:NitT/TauT family transport system ATP-binding protein
MDRRQNAVGTDRLPVAGATSAVSPNPGLVAVPVVPLTVLRLEDVNYSYPNGPLVLHDLNLSIDAGKVIGLVGPSGCGKSTILGILAGFVTPDSGRVHRHARLHSASGRKLKKRALTMVFQDDTVLPWKTVAANVAFGMRYIDISPREREKRVSELLRLARIGEFKDRYPYQLSGGQRRRLQFLMSVAPGPQVLLLDEPFSALDEPTRLGVHKDVLNVIRELEMTVVIVTHDLGEAVSLSDEVHLLTRRPAGISCTYQTPFPRERDVFALRETREYLNLYRQVWHDLRQQISDIGE